MVSNRERNTRVITTKKNETVSRGRGRPRSFDTDEALDIALEVFWRLGYEGASISDLTQAMGLCPTSLYAAFGSKAALYREALARYGSRDGAFTAALAAREGSARDAVACVLRECASRFADPAHPPGCMISTAVLACAKENGEVADHLASLRRHVSLAFAARIEAGIASGELPPGTNSQAMARFYASVIQGMSVQATDGADGKALRLIADMAMDAWDDVAARSRVG